MLRTILKTDETPAAPSAVRRLCELQQGDEFVRSKLAKCYVQLERLHGDARQEAVLNLARLAEPHMDTTIEQLQRVCYSAYQIAANLAGHGHYTEQLDDQFLAEFQLATLLHDIGNAALPDALLLKPGPLDRDEFELMKLHTVVGGEMLESCPEGESDPFHKLGAQIARSHHERWDGLGYPRGLAGEEIPLAARIFTVADVFHALVFQRPYHAAFPPPIARQIVEDGAGKQFDPLAVAAFCRQTGDSRDDVAEFEASVGSRIPT